VALLLASLSTNAIAAACALDTPATTISMSGATHEPGSTLFQVWELDDSAAFWAAETPDSAGYSSFERHLKESGLDTDPASLLRIEQQPGESAADVFNRSVALERAETLIGPANCLERLLIGMQNERMPILETSTEFAAVILRSADGSRLRVYHFAKNSGGFGGLGELLAPVGRDHRAGWTVHAFLHNHNFRAGPNVSSGVTAPSAADAQSQLSLAANLQLQEAWITNGIHTIRIPAAEFGRFKSSE
jgi:hypothetical protein